MQPSPYTFSESVVEQADARWCVAPVSPTSSPTEVLKPEKVRTSKESNAGARVTAGNGRVLSSEFWPELQFLAQLLLDFGGIMLTSF